MASRQSQRAQWGPNTTHFEEGTMQFGPDPILEAQRMYVNIGIDDALWSGNYSIYGGSWELGDEGRWHWQWTCGLREAKRMDWFWTEGRMGGEDEGGYAGAQHPSMRTCKTWKGGIKGALEYCLKGVTEDPIWQDRYIAVGFQLVFDGQGHNGGPSVILEGGRQGKSHDTLHFIQEVMTAGEVTKDIVTAHPLAALRHYNNASKIAALFARPETFEKELYVELVYGPGDAGKSHWVRFQSDQGPQGDAEHTWEPPLGKGTDIWFDGLRSSDKYAVIDEMDGEYNGWTIDRLKQFLDKWRLQVPVKNGHAWFRATYVGICTNYKPRRWFPKRCQRMAEWYPIVRRFNRLVIMHDRDNFDIHERGTATFNDFFGYDPDKD